MNPTEVEYDRIEGLLPLQRGNVRVDNLTFLNAILYVLVFVDRMYYKTKGYGKSLVS